jgi:signal transduction histidine kinase
MRSLYLRIWVTVVAALVLFAVASGWLVQRRFQEQIGRNDGAMRERVAAWAELLQRSLPGPEAPVVEQAEALREWSQRLRLPLALDDAAGKRVAASDSFVRRDIRPEQADRVQSIRFNDGRVLHLPRPAPNRAAAAARPGPGAEWLAPWMVARALPEWAGFAALLLVLLLAVAGGAWPVVRRLTRRLEALKSGVEAFGAGALHQRVAEDGRDEVAALGASFNRAAGRIEALLRSHQSLLANASHELRSPLARLKMALALAEEASPAQRATLRREIDTNIAELDALVEEVLLASRLDASSDIDCSEPVTLLALAAEEAARVGALAHGDDVQLNGNERLLRRALRNLLENAHRYGGSGIEVQVVAQGGGAELRVCDRGPGVPEVYRARIFEAFFRLPGHAEREGGVGLGLSLVRQIAERHGGSVRCVPREGGGSCFELMLAATAPLAAPRWAAAPTPSAR